MKHILLAGLLCLFFSHPAHAGSISFGSGGNQFNMEFVEIGNPGNADDTTGDPNPAGSVGYTYQIGKFEVSEDMIEKFNASQSLAITKDTRGTNKPATSVSWNEAARFVNWLNTSTGGSAAYNFTTGGVNDNIALWTAADTLDFDAANPFRSLRANFVLPSMDEWYKAAYYDPNTSTYFNYPTGSDTPPTAVASGTNAGTAVYGQSWLAGPADITNAGGLSPYGVMSLGGNVYEWEESELDLINNNPSSARRGIRGGDWVNDSVFLSSSTRHFGVAAWRSGDVRGFRVASLSTPAAVPEPSSLVPMLTGLAGLGWYGRRRVRK